MAGTSDLDSERMVQMSLRDTAGRYRFPGMNGVQLEQIRLARTVESAVAEDGWNLRSGFGAHGPDVAARHRGPIPLSRHERGPARADPAGPHGRERRRRGWLEPPIWIRSAWSRCRCATPRADTAFPA